MHATLRITPFRPSSRQAKGLHFERPATVGKEIAGGALRVALAIAESGALDFPGLESGKIILPKAVLPRLNAMAGEPHVPSLMLELEDGAAIQVFADRSLLLFKREVASSNRWETTLVEAFPQILKLPKTMELSNGLRPELRTRPDGEKVILEVRHVGGQFSDLFSDQTSAGARQLITQEIAREIRAWIIASDQHPAIRRPRAGEARNHRPATRDGGVWPAAFPHTNFSTDQFQQAERFFQAAWTHLHEHHLSELEDAAVRVDAAAPRQDGVATRIDVKAKAIAKSRRPGSHAAAEKRLASIFKRLLRHPSAPEGLAHFSSNTVVEHGTDKGRTEIKRHTLFAAQMSKDIPSAHDRLKAFSIFGGA